MSIPGSATPLLLATTAAAGPPAALQIDRSLRFNSADSAYLNRTPSSAGNRKTWTWSGWVKKSTSVRGVLFGGGTTQSDTQFTSIEFESDDTLRVTGWNTLWAKSDALFRDYSAWAHVVISFDSTQSSAGDQIKMYVNGQQLTKATENALSQNGDYGINQTVRHTIGAISEDANPKNDFYLAEINFIDGQALAPTDFGQTDSDNNWNPKAYSGTYGTNGFHLDFADPADLGDDNSGNGNDWTPNNLVGSAGLATANQGFDVVTYTGNGSTQSITGLKFQPDFVWIKNRDSASYGHRLVDSVRGSTKYLMSHSTGAEATDSNGVTSFNSDGFTVGSSGDYNVNGNNFVAWAWKAGGTASSNTDGTITSSVSANTTYGFSIVSYTGVKTASTTVGHGLNAAPALIILKDRDNGAYNWQVYHEAFANTDSSIVLNSNAATATSSATVWNSTAPTSTVFTIGTSDGVNKSGDDYIAYCWSEVSGFSKFGSYTGNGSSTGPVVTTGFKPKFVMVKSATNAAHWDIFDTVRDTSNPRSKVLRADSAAAEFDTPTGTFGIAIDVLDDGFQLKSGSSTNDVNQTNETYIFAAFADKPPGEIIDSLIDTPTNYEAASGNNGGNYATWNPLSSSGVTLSNGNLDATNSNSATKIASSTIVPTAKCYWEVTIETPRTGAIGGIHGVNAQGGRPDQSGGAGIYLASSGGGGGTYVNGTQTAADFSASAGDIIGFAFDPATRGLIITRNGSSVGTLTAPDTDNLQPVSALNQNVAINANFGQRPFAYTPPTGYKSLCTQNLPDPTIADGSTAFDTKLWTGTGSSRSITGYNFSPDWVWIKQRDTTRSNNTFDIVRGANRPIFTDLTNAELSDGRLTSFDSTGFTLDSDNAVNDNNGSYVGWAWDAGTSTVSNTDGSITSSVRANASAGFSIVSWSGTGSNATIGHNLNAKPGLVIVKNRSATASWAVWSTALSGSQFLGLNTTNAAQTSSNYWNSAEPTSSVINVGTDSSANGNGNNMIAYCFAPVAGYSAFGSYTGNGSSDGPFVYTGFRPRYLLTKASSAAGTWIVRDTERDEFNSTTSAKLAPNYSYEENNSSFIGLASQTLADFLSNGFKVRSTGGISNDSGVTYVWAAFAEHPFKTARAR